MCSYTITDKSFRFGPNNIFNPINETWNSREKKLNFYYFIQIQKKSHRRHENFDRPMANVPSQSQNHLLKQ
jgi:hypothetical protein